MIHELLSAALKRATEALGGDDAIAASAALRQAAEACEAALRQGLQIEPADVRVLRPIFTECCAASDATHGRIADALAATGKACRASGAYRR